MGSAPKIQVATADRAAAIMTALQAIDGHANDPDTTRTYDPTRPIWEQDERFLNPFEELPEISTWCKMGDRPALPKDGVISVDAKWKQGKSLCSYAICIPLLSGRPFGNITPLGPPPRLVMVADVEMSKRSLLPRYKAIRATIGDNANNFVILPLLGYDRRQLWPTIESAAQTYNPDVLIVDHISAFVSDINSNDETTETIGHLSALGKERTVICVIHQNKGKEDTNMRGALGTAVGFLQVESYTAEKQKGYYSLKLNSARDTDAEGATPFEFALTIDGNKQLVGFMDAAQISADEKRQAAENGMAVWLAEARRWFGHNEELPKNALIQAAAKERRLNIANPNEYKKAENAVANAAAAGAIIKQGGAKTRAPYRLAKL